jgi:hypothetical protein
VIPRLSLGLLLMIAGSTVSAQSPRGDRDFAPMANPSALVSAELAFARLAAEKGQWTAFRKTATKDAVMFVPQAINAQSWLKGRADPPQAVRWQPHEVYVACDGSLGATTGAWQRPDGSQGYFTTLWQRQKDGDYKWLIDHGDALAKPRPAPEVIKAQVADCADPSRFMRVEKRSDARRAAKTAAKGSLVPLAPPVALDGASQDGTLRWSWAVEQDGARRLDVMVRSAGAMTIVIDDRVLASSGSSGGQP